MSTNGSFRHWSMRTRGAALAAAALLSHLACTRPDRNPPMSPAAPVSDQQLLDSLRNAEFRSVELHPTGLGPDGEPALGYWEMTLSDGHRLSYTASDFSVVGSWSCRDGLLFLSPFEPNPATYDPATGILVANGVAYVRMK